MTSRGCRHDPGFLAQIAKTPPADQIDVARFDAIVVADGQGPMFTFERAVGLQRKLAEFCEAGKLAAALCHGTAILRYARLSSGEPIVSGAETAQLVIESLGR